MSIADYVLTRLALFVAGVGFLGTIQLYRQLNPGESGQWHQLYGVPLEGLVVAFVVFVVVLTVVMLTGLLVRSRT